MAKYIVKLDGELDVYGVVIADTLTKAHNELNKMQREGRIPLGRMYLVNVRRAGMKLRGLVGLGPKEKKTEKIDITDVTMGGEHP